MTSKEALEILVKQANERKLSNKIVANGIAVSVLEKLVEQAQKREKLLELYKELITVKNDMFSYCEVVDDIYYYMAETETDLEQQINEIEK